LSGIACDPYPQDDNYVISAGAGSGGVATGGSVAIAGAAGGDTTSGGSASGGSASAGAAGGGCPRQELLINGNFDAGVGDWIESSKVWPNLITTAEMSGASVLPQSGSRFARLGGHIAAATDGLMLSIEIPATARDIVFSYYSLVTTTDTSTDPHDTLYVFMDSDEIYAQETLDNTNAHSAWRRFEVAVKESAAGKYQALLIRAESNDDTLATTFYVDSFSLSAAVCP
jgi:hypothetical protein